MSYLVYFDAPGKERRYLRRLAACGFCPLWHTDQADAKRLDEAEAQRLARWFHQRSLGCGRQPPTLPVGEYGYIAS